MDRLKSDQVRIKSNQIHDIQIKIDPNTVLSPPMTRVRSGENKRVAASSYHGVAPPVSSRLASLLSAPESRHLLSPIPSLRSRPHSPFHDCRDSHSRSLICPMRIGRLIYVFYDDKSLAVGCESHHRR